jgi:hypothetical protein
MDISHPNGFQGTSIGSFDRTLLDGSKGGKFCPIRAEVAARTTIDNSTTFRLRDLK